MNELKVPHREKTVESCDCGRSRQITITVWRTTEVHSKFKKLRKKISVQIPVILNIFGPSTSAFALGSDFPSICGNLVPKYINLIRINLLCVLPTHYITCQKIDLRQFLENLSSYEVLQRNCLGDLSQIAVTSTAMRFCIYLWYELLLYNSLVIFISHL